MRIGQVYKKYQIMPQLSLHMQRVAGVGKLILSGWKAEIDHDLVIRTLLLHDMGNIVKFDLNNPLMPIDNLENWVNIQKKYWDKYGKNTHDVTKRILREIDQIDASDVMDKEAEGYISGDTLNLLRQDWPAKILAYCDVRVVPSGVVPMKKRIEDLKNRYGRDLEWYNFLYQLEKDLAEMTTTNIQEITEESVKPFFDELLEYQL